MSIEEVIAQFPVTREQIDILMAFIARSLQKEAVFSEAVESAHTFR